MILLPLNENAASGAWRPRAPRGRSRRGLGRVLDEYDLVPLADGGDRVVVAALAVEVDGDHRADAAAGALAASSSASSSSSGRAVQLSSQSTKKGVAPV